VKRRSCGRGVVWRRGREDEWGHAPLPVTQAVKASFMQMGLRDGAPVPTGWLLKKARRLTQTARESESVRRASALVFQWQFPAHCPVCTRKQPAVQNHQTGEWRCTCVRRFYSGFLAPSKGEL